VTSSPEGLARVIETETIEKLRREAGTVSNALSGRRSVAPLETEVQAIQLSSYRASLAASAMVTAFSPVTAFLTCSGPLSLSRAGQ